jgi:pimeloyl-ACP methyl ester carboxylesterase
VLSDTLVWRGRSVRWERLGAGPAVVFCHGTPWSSALWRPYAEALADRYTTYLWDMPGYGESSKDAAHPVSLDVQGELMADLLEHWELGSPHVVAHDVGGAVALRAHLLHRAAYASLALVDVVALAPWGSEFFRLAGDNAEVFGAVPPAIHEGLVRAYIASASHHELSPATMESLVSPWRGEEGQAAFYHQIAQAEQRHTDQVEPFYQEMTIPVLVVWGEQDTWIPVDRAHRLCSAIPGARARIVKAAGHLIQIDQPVALATQLSRWLSDHS